MIKIDKNYEYFQEVDRLTTEKLELEIAAHGFYNKAWKLMNQYRFTRKLIVKKEDKIIQTISGFKGIKYIKKKGGSSNGTP